MHWRILTKLVTITQLLPRPHDTDDISRSWSQRSRSGSDGHAKLEPLKWYEPKLTQILTTLGKRTDYIFKVIFIIIIIIIRGFIVRLVTNIGHRCITESSKLSANTESRTKNVCLESFSKKSRISDSTGGHISRSHKRLPADALYRSTDTKLAIFVTFWIHIKHNVYRFVST